MKFLFFCFFLSFILGQLGAIPFLSSATVYIHEIFLVLLVAVAIFKYNALRIFKEKVLLPWILFGGIGGISLLANATRFAPVELGVSTLYLVRWILYAMLIPTVLVLPMMEWLWGLYMSGVVLAILGFMQYFLYPDLRNLYYLGWDPHYYRLFSTFLDPNFVGIFLVLALTLSFVFKRTWVLVGTQMVLLVALVLTFSRSSYVALFVVLGVMMVAKKQWVLGLASIVVFLGVLVFIPKPPGEGGNLTRTVSTLARFGNWQRSFQVARESPLFGYGFDTLRYIDALGAVDVGGQIYSRAGAGVDSSILFILLTTGVVGLGSYLWIFWRIARLTVSHRDKTFCMVIFASFAAVTVHSLFVNSLFYPWVMAWLWILVGVLMKTRSGKNEFG